jgi:hypothetical protein
MGKREKREKEKRNLQIPAFSPSTLFAFLINGHHILRNILKEYLWPRLYLL